MARKRDKSRRRRNSNLQAQKPNRRVEHAEFSWILTSARSHCKQIVDKNAEILEERAFVPVIRSPKVITEVSHAPHSSSSTDWGRNTCVGHFLRHVRAAPTQELRFENSTCAFCDTAHDLSGLSDELFDCALSAAEDGDTDRGYRDVANLLRDQLRGFARRFMIVDMA